MQRIMFVQFFLLHTFAAVAQSDDSVFTSYMRWLNPSIEFVNGSIQKSNFAFFRARNAKDQARVTWMRYGEDYYVAIVQQIFEESHYLTSSDIVLFDARSRRLMVFVTTEEFSVNCLPYISFSNLLQSVYSCYVIDECLNLSGFFDFSQSTLVRGPLYIHFRNDRYYSIRVEDANEQCNNLALLLNYEMLIQFGSMVFEIDGKKDPSLFKEKNEDYYFMEDYLRKKVEVRKRSEGFKCF